MAKSRRGREVAISDGSARENGEKQEKNVAYLKRTDTTLDLSQKAKRAKERREKREVEKLGEERYYIPELRRVTAGGVPPRKRFQILSEAGYFLLLAVGHAVR